MAQNQETQPQAAQMPPNVLPNLYPNLHQNAHPNAHPNVHPNSHPNSHPNAHPNAHQNVNIFVQSINDRVLSLYTELHKLSNITKDTRLAILKSTKVRPRALIRTLQNYAKDCKCPDLKNEVQGLIYSLEDMMPGGETRLFVCHNKQNVSTQLEFVCGAVRMYKEEGEIVCDFCLSTYSYAKFIDKEALAMGIGSLSSGLVFGALAIASGGTGLVVLGAFAGIMSLMGIGLTAAALDTSLSDNIRDILEASFLHELVSRGHAVLQDRRLFINNE